MSEDRLQGQRVLVVGASSGIGAAVARAFAAGGARVTAVGRNRDKLDELAAGLGGEAVVLDVCDNDLVVSFLAGQEPFDHVVVTAASRIAGSVAGLSVGEARAAMDAKFWGAYHIARAAKIVPTGSLTFVSGLVSSRPSASSVIQGSINAALEALARGLALERAPIRVNTISPGLIDTPRVPEDAREALFRKMTDKLPVGRIGEPDDVAAAILFAATNPYVTGATINVDGGAAIMP